MAAHLSADLRALQEDLQVKFGDPLLMTTAHHGSNPSLTPDREDSVARRKPSLGYQEEKFANSRLKHFLFFCKLYWYSKRKKN